MPLKFKFCGLMLVAMFAIGGGVAFAGGSNGSEVLGEVKGLKNPDESETLMESLKGIFSKDKNSKTDAKEGAEKAAYPAASAADSAGGEQPEAVKIEGADESGKDKSAAKKDESGDSGEKKPKEYITKAERDFPLECAVTPSLKPDNIPLQKIKKGNNLLRKPGAARRANGQYVEIRGRVVDEDCLPISDAEVQIWQTDSAGKYEDDYATNSEWDIVDKNYDKNFGYSGAAQTNNLGEFSFITILPAMYEKDLAPHINFYVRHPEFKEVATMMFFGKHPRNEIDRNLKTLTPEQRDVLISNGRKLDPQGRLEGRVYDFLVTMQGVNKYRRY